MFVYELSGYGFESSFSHLNFRFRACLEQGVPWHSGNYRERIHSETRTWHDKNIQYLLIAFGFNFKSLILIHTYLNDRIQVTKADSFYSEILQIIYGAPQGSTLGPLLYNVDLIYLFLVEHYKSDFSCYADDTTAHNCWSTFLETISDLEIT